MTIAAPNLDLSSSPAPVLAIAAFNSAKQEQASILQLFQPAQANSAGAVAADGSRGTQINQSA